ncbi:putative VP1 [Gokushovirinae sp.]|nr:putative VP1 [Gokushovirinae sp.]
MNRNNERHFLNVPQIHTSRTRFNRDQTILTTFNSGALIPFFVDEVLPGDTFQIDTSAIIRMTTPKYPVMDDAFIDFYYFYVPNRIIWDDFKKFMGEAEETPWMPEKTYKVPTILLGVGAEGGTAQPYEESILDYMGVPTKSVPAGSRSVKINALPVRAYVKIWNEYFRDENLGNPAALITSSMDIEYPDVENDPELKRAWDTAYGGGRCLPVNKFHDYFTSCLPYPQRGPEVTIPMTGNATIKGYTDGSYTTAIEAPMYPLRNGSVTQGTTMEVSENDTIIQNNNKQAYLGADLSTVSATTINELRKAVAVQQYYEAMARGGSRYREQVKAMWNVTISDKTVQIPEYLGGGRYHVNMNQIVQTSGQQGQNDTPIGETGAMSVTPINESSFTKSFEEHGFVIGVCCVRHNRSYQQGLERFWSRSDRLDYYVPQFANLGEQPVKKKEIMLTGKATDEETFGYQEAWADYRMKPNRVSGKMRSNAQGTLDFWHYADNYEKVPTLSEEWMREGKKEIARTLIVQDEPQFFGAIRVANKTTRCMPLYSVPGLDKL